MFSELTDTFSVQSFTVWSGILFFSHPESEESIKIAKAAFDSQWCLCAHIHVRQVQTVTSTSETLNQHRMVSFGEGFCGIAWN